MLDFREFVLGIDRRQAHLKGKNTNNRYLAPRFNFKLDCSSDQDATSESDGKLLAATVSLGGWPACFLLTRAEERIGLWFMTSWMGRPTSRFTHLSTAHQVWTLPRPCEKACLQTSMSGHLQRQLTNAEIAELLARRADQTRPPAQRALRRASRRAFLWEEEASQLFHSQRSLTELSGVGPYIARLMQDWIAAPPRVPKPPPIRGGFITFPKAHASLVRQNGWLGGIKGDLQMHTVWSDGSSTIAEMASAAIERGYEYIAITDHSKGLKIAGGINEVQLEEQSGEILSINAFFAAKGHKFRILRSIELNLNPQGVGDMSCDALHKLDIVLGCFHSALRKTEDQTDRYLAALRNPAVHILGHPRGRVYNFRLGLTADWPAIFKEAAELDKAVEIDGYPDRQDLSPDLVRLVAKAGCRVSLGTDSHGASQLRFMEFSAASAVLGGLKPGRILNFMSAEELIGWVQSLRSRRAA